MRGTDLNTIERPYDGCGKCLLGVRRLSRVKLATSSPERQRENVLTAAASVGAHIIGWADDWEVSGATDPVTRPSLGPWLRDEKGPYDGLVAAAVDRLGRNVVDCLNTGYKMVGVEGGGADHDAESRYGGEQVGSHVFGGLGLQQAG